MASVSLYCFSCWEFCMQVIQNIVFPVAAEAISKLYGLTSPVCVSSLCLGVATAADLISLCLSLPESVSGWLHGPSCWAAAVGTALHGWSLLFDSLVGLGVEERTEL